MNAVKFTVPDLDGDNESKQTTKVYLVFLWAILKAMYPIQQRNPFTAVIAVMAMAKL